jgi:hypothetical protein
MSEPERLSRRLQRMLPLGVAALGVVAGLMLAVYFISRPGQPVGQASPTATAADSGPAGPSAAVSPAASDTPTPEASSMPEASSSGAASGVARLGWTAGRSQPGRVSGVARFGDRWVAGGTVDSGPTSHAAVWTSEDGVTWSEPILLEPEPVEEEGLWTRYWINGFGEWDGDLLAYGWNGFCCGDGGYAMLWRSPDGATWEVVDVAGSAFGDEYHFPQTSVVAPDGRLAVLTGTGLGNGTALALTADLQAWEFHPVPRNNTNLYLQGFAASSDRIIVVGVADGETTPDGETLAVPAIYTSTDGETWSAVDPPDSRGTIGGVAWHDPSGRFVVVGRDAAGLPFAWLTADGGAWTPIALGDQPAAMHRVIVAGDLIVATGESGAVGATQPGDTIVWSSYDGLSWWYATVLEGRSGAVMAATPDAAILVANRSTQANDDSWLSLIGTLTTDE